MCIYITVVCVHAVKFTVPGVDLFICDASALLIVQIV